MRQAHDKVKVIGLYKSINIDKYSTRERVASLDSLINNDQMHAWQMGHGQYNLRLTTMSKQD